MSFDFADFDMHDDYLDVEMNDEEGVNRAARMPYEWLARPRDPSKLRKRVDVSPGVSYQDQLKSLQEKVNRENTTSKESAAKTSRLVKRKPGQPMTYSERVHQLSMEKSSENVDEESAGYYKTR